MRKRRSPGLNKRKNNPSSRIFLRRLCGKGTKQKNPFFKSRFVGSNLCYSSFCGRSVVRAKGSLETMICYSGALLGSDDPVICLPFEKPQKAAPLYTWRKNREKKNRKSRRRSFKILPTEPYQRIIGHFHFAAIPFSMPLSRKHLILSGSLPIHLTRPSLSYRPTVGHRLLKMDVSQSPSLRQHLDLSPFFAKKISASLNTHSCRFCLRCDFLPGFIQFLVPSVRVFSLPRRSNVRGERKAFDTRDVHAPKPSLTASPTTKQTREWVMKTFLIAATFCPHFHPPQRFTAFLLWTCHFVVSAVAEKSWVKRRYDTAHKYTRSISGHQTAILSCCLHLSSIRPEQVRAILCPNQNPFSRLYKYVNANPWAKITDEKASFGDGKGAERGKLRKTNLCSKLKPAFACASEMGVFWAERKNLLGDECSFVCYFATISFRAVLRQPQWSFRAIKKGN